MHDDPYFGSDFKTHPDEPQTPICNRPPGLCASQRIDVIRCVWGGSCPSKIPERPVPTANSGARKQECGGACHDPATRTVQNEKGIGS